MTPKGRDKRLPDVKARSALASIRRFASGAVQPSALLLAASALAPSAAASDALVIVRGQVVLQRGQGITAGPFAGVQVGDTYTYVGGIDRPLPGSPTTGSVECESDHRTFYLRVGSAFVTEANFTLPGTATVGNDVVENGLAPYDLIVMGRSISEQGSPALFYVDPTGADFQTNDITQLSGVYAQNFPDALVTLSGPSLFSGFSCTVDSLEIVQRSAFAQLGQTVCTQTTPNSTGMLGQLDAEGFDHVFANELVLRGTKLPVGQFALLIASRTAIPPQLVFGSAGRICVGGSIGRFNDQILPIGTSTAFPGGGTVVFRPDLEALPQGAGTVPAMAGATWTFQAWHRDVLGGGATSNFTSAVSVTFR